MQPTEDERVLAALAHAGIVTNTFNLAGMIAAALIWSTERERSPYVRAHAFQALVYQGVVMLCTFLLFALWGVCVGLSFLPALLRPDLYRDNAPPALFWLALVGLLVPLTFAGAATLYALYGAYQAYRGRPFRYSLTSRLTGRDSTGRSAALAAPPAIAEAPPAVEEHPPADAAPQAAIDPALAPDPQAEAVPSQTVPQAAIDPALAPDPFAEDAPSQTVPQAAIDPSLAPDPFAEDAPSQSVPQSPIDSALVPDPLDLAPPDEPLAVTEAEASPPTPESEPARSEGATGTTNIEPRTKNREPRTKKSAP